MYGGRCTTVDSCIHARVYAMRKIVTVTIYSLSKISESATRITSFLELVNSRKDVIPRIS